MASGASRSNISISATAAASPKRRAGSPFNVESFSENLRKEPTGGDRRRPRGQNSAPSEAARDSTSGILKMVKRCPRRRNSRPIAVIPVTWLVPGGQTAPKCMSLGKIRDDYMAAKWVLARSRPDLVSAAATACSASRGDGCDSSANSPDSRMSRSAVKNVAAACPFHCVWSKRNKKA